MQLNHLTDSQLHESLLKHDRQHKETLVAILHHLKEVESRRLYSEMKCSSLFDYATKLLAWSEDETYKRISAMRLLRDLPQIEEQIGDGSLTLSNLNIAQTLFRREAKEGRTYSSVTKLEFVGSLIGKTKREAEQIAAEISPSIRKPDRIAVISQSQVGLNYAANLKLTQLIDELKGLVAHTHPNITLGELTELAFTEAIAKLRQDRTSTSKSPVPGRVTSRQSVAAIRRSVWKRDKACVNCGSSHALELDHIVPKAKGGVTSVENLRVLCRACNQRAAILEFGLAKMRRHLRSP